MHDQKVTLLHLYILQGKKATTTEYFNCFAKSVLGTATATLTVLPNLYLEPPLQESLCMILSILVPFI